MFELNETAKQAIKNFRDAKPWKGTFEERLAKFQKLRGELSEAFDGVSPILKFVGEEQPARLVGGCEWKPEENTIELHYKLSAVSFLFCFALACGEPEMSALIKAKAIFRHYFPRSAANTVNFCGLMVKRPRPESRLTPPPVVPNDERGMAESEGNDDPREIDFDDDCE